MINYYHRFLPHIADIISPLYTSLRGKPTKLQWGPEQQQAFEKAKTALAAATSLSFPAPNGDLQLSTDASKTAIGAVLEQIVNNKP